MKETTQTKYRIKKLAEFEAVYTKDYDGDYRVDRTWFNTRGMSHLYGVELTDSEAYQILSLDEDDSVRLDLQNGPADKDNNWRFSRGMIIEIKTTKKSYLKDMKETTQTISRKNLGLIHDIACSTWKSTIEDWMKEQGVFLEEYTLQNKTVSQMFKDSSETQKATLLKAGLTNPTAIDHLDLSKKIITIDGITFENLLTENDNIFSLISRRSSADDKYDNCSYYLSPFFTWTIESDNNCQVLVPKYKK
jgi:hypothetical protein